MTENKPTMSTFEVQTSLTKGVEAVERKAQRNDRLVAQSPLIKTEISPLYARYVGSYITIAHNGNFMKLPVDGSEIYLSKGHYETLRKYIRHIDKQILISQKQTKFMGDNAVGDFQKL